MAMRPRTFRRLVLAGSLLAVLLIGAVGYFVIAPMQERNSIEKLRSTGMKAYEDEDYATATQNLRRFLRNMNPSPPEELLAFARSQVKVESNDSGHLRASISAYRDYLILRPDDIEASMELLKLFNRNRMYPEARSLAESLKERPGIDRKGVLFEELTARTLTDTKDAAIRGIFDELLSMGDPDFPTVWKYSEWLKATGRQAESIAFLDKMIVEHPDNAGASVLRAVANNRLDNALLRGPDEVNKLVQELTSFIGWNNEQYAWESDAEIGSIDLGKIVVRALDLLGRADLAMEVTGKNAEESDDPILYGWYARRLWWANQNERLLGIEYSGSDFLGFKALAAARLGDESAEQQAKEALDGIRTDFRAKGWALFLDAKDLFDQGELIEARTILAQAIAANPMEPTFYLVQGDINSALGREGDAKEKWALAAEQAKPAVWAEPSLRIIYSLQDSGHLSEAGAVASDLAKRAWTIPEVLFVRVQSQAAMAREKLLDQAEIDQALSFALDLVEYLPEGQRAQLRTIVTILLAESGRKNDAAEELARTLESEPSADIFARIIELDQYYNLGVVDHSSVDSAAIAVRNPGSALGYAQRLYLNNGDRDAAIAIIDQGTESAAPNDPAWGLARAKFLDFIDDEESSQAWRALIDQHPENIEILMSSLDTDALGLDLDFVEQTISRIIELTSSKGRTEPTRLRLARARAIVSRGTLTRSSRDRAISIIRSVIASDAKNIKARLMLSNILNMECPPQFGPNDDEFFERDPVAAAAENLMISRLIAGPMAQRYLFRVSQLNVDLGDNEAARQNLLEAYARSAGDLEAQFTIIEELRRANEYALAIPRLADLIQRSQGARQIDYQIALARMLGGLNRRGDMLPILQAVEQADALTRDQLIDLVGLYYQIGYTAEAQQLVGSGTRYGLNQAEIQHTRFEYARMTGAVEEAEDILRAMIDADPAKIDAWTSLSTLLIENDQLEEAKTLLEDGLAQNPQNEQIEYQLALLSGDLSKIGQLVTDSETLAEADAKLAMQLLVEFENTRDEMTYQQTLDRLDELAIRFPNMIAVQRFVYSTKITMNPDYNQLGKDAEAAARRLQTDIGLLEIATRAYSNGGNWAAIMQTTDAWRGKIEGTPLQPDLFAARAAFELKDPIRTKSLLAPYFQTATVNTDQAIYRELLLLYARASIALGEPQETLRAEFEPIALSSAQFRNSVWLTLAASSVSNYSEAVRWIELAQSKSAPADLERITEAWQILATRFPENEGQLVQRSVAAAEEWLRSEPDNPVALAMTARSLRILADSLEYADPQREIYLTRAVDLYDQAAARDAQDPNYLFGAAQNADATGDYDGAAVRYRSLIAAFPMIDGIFKAAVQNNLAGALEKSSTDPAVLAEAESLAKQAVAFQEYPAFLGTLGWIQLKLGDSEAAAGTFRRILVSNPESLEGWGGLAVALQNTDDAGSRSALAQLERFTPENGLNPSLSTHLSSFGMRVEIDSSSP